MSVSLIPAMTGASSPAPYVVSASGSYSTSYPYLAFDKNDASYWRVFSSSGWLQIDLGTAQTATEYKVRSNGGTNGTEPKDWTLQGSNDGTAWNVLDTQTGKTWPGAEHLLTVATPGAYRYYRLNITTTVNPGTSFLYVDEFDLFGEAPTMGLGAALGAEAALTANLSIPGKAALSAALAAESTLTAALDSQGVASLRATLAGDSTLSAALTAIPVERAESIRVDRRFGRTRECVWTVEVEPPVTESIRTRGHDYAAAVSISGTTLVDGRPT